MVGKVTRLHTRIKGKKADRLTKAERRACLAERQGQWTQQWIALAEGFIQTLLGGEVAELLGRPEHRWGDRTEEMEVNACCNGCGRKHRGWFRRNGSYTRSLVIEGRIIDFRVPRVRGASGGPVEVGVWGVVP